MDESLVEAVRRRAGNACEYCQMPQWLYPTVVFPIDHIIALHHDGLTVLSNLALSCLHCNSHKGSNIAGRDPLTKKLTPLYHPRRHKWHAHFRWNGPELVGRTPIGRVTVAVLKLNAPEYVAVRAELIGEGHFPPAELH
jgi:hypothetical protein